MELHLAQQQEVAELQTPEVGQAVEGQVWGLVLTAVKAAPAS